jgi:hypothetical protein
LLEAGTETAAKMTAGRMTKRKKKNYVKERVIDTEAESPAQAHSLR